MIAPLVQPIITIVVIVGVSQDTKVTTLIQMVRVGDLPVMRMTTEELIESLRRPMFNYTMSMHGDSYFAGPNGEQWRKGCATKKAKAIKEIDALLFQYAATNFYYKELRHHA